MGQRPLLLRTLVAGLAAVVITAPASPASFQGRCLSTPNGKAKGGQLQVGSERIRFVSGTFNQEASVGAIKRISAGEFAKRRVKGAIIGTVLLSPIALFALIGKKKREMFAIEYEGADGEASVLVFQVKKRRGFAVQSALEAATGLEVEWQEERAPMKEG